MHLYLQLTRSLAVTLIWLYCNKLVLRYVRLRVSDPGQVSIPQPGIVTHIVNFKHNFHKEIETFFKNKLKWIQEICFKMNPLLSELPFHAHNWLIISLKDFCIVIRKWPTFWPSKKMAANLTQIINFKVNFHQEFELFLTKKIYANNGGHF